MTRANKPPRDGAKRRSIAKALAYPGVEDVDIEPRRVKLVLKVPFQEDAPTRGPSGPKGRARR